MSAVRKWLAKPAIGWHPIFVPISIFLIVFGLMNFAELPLGWKDRTEQIGRYLANTVGLDGGWIGPVLWLAKIVEAALGIAALVSLLRRDSRLLVACIVGWMAWFTGFTAMDVWAADRAELVEHSIYFGVFAQLLMVVTVLGLARRFEIRLSTSGVQREKQSVE